MTREDIDMVYSFDGYANKICMNVQNAQDLIQDIFLRILNNPATFEGLTRAQKRQYIVCAIHNGNIDKSRRLKSKGRVKYHVPIEESNASINPDVYGKIELKEVLKTGKRYKHFETLLLNASGYDSYEIAAAKNMNLNTVLGAYRYSRLFLKKCT